ncbi:hypothetical protein [Nocardiopsis quinghaiensis]|uniref:hypothetical protein n=1 Tax=Nocardiopsis quinghaiensis TaxID=464995 RepID=UPI001239F3A3|nr:hypothetical protein [Nocardiopsis quinghaiensis]
MATKSKAKDTWRYWGIGAILFTLFGWLIPEVGPMMIMIGSVVSVLYIFFQMPLPCGAWNRGDKGRCRNNSSGLLPGCHLEAHRWQNVKWMLRTGKWAELRAKVFASWKRALPAVVAAATIVSGMAAVAQLAVSVVVA